MAVKAAFFLPNLYSWHGVGRWVLALARHSDPAKLQWTGAAIGGFGMVDYAGCQELSRWMPLFADTPGRPWPDKGLVARCKNLNEAIRHAADGAQVLLTWGSGKVLTYLDLPPIPLVMVSHTTNWWPTSGREHVQHYAAVSEVAAKPFRRIASEVTVIHNGVEPERVTPRDPEGLRGQLVGEGKRLIGYLGRLDGAKSPESLKECLTDPVNVLVTMGNSLADNKELREHPRVRQLPAKQLVGDFLGAIDMLLHPAKEEAFGLSVVEAWLAGAPVCCYPVGIIPELEPVHGPLRWAWCEGVHSPHTISRHEGRVEVARKVAWRQFTAGAMANRWANYLEGIAETTPFRRLQPFPSLSMGRATVATWDQPTGRVAEWQVGIVSCARPKPTLERTLASMREAGFPEPTIYFDGPDAPETSWGQVSPTVGRLGAWPNWLRMLRGLYTNSPAADVYLLCEDDVVFCKDVYPYLCRVLWPKEAKVCSLYTSAHFRENDEIRPPGFRGVSGIGIGALAYLLPRETVREMVNDQRLTCGPHKYADANVAEWAGKIHYHFPSLAEHTGETSTLWPDEHIAKGEHRRRAHRFVGEDFSAVSFLQQFGCVVPAPKRGVFPWPGEQVCVAPLIPGDRPLVACDVVVPYDETTCPWMPAAVESLLHQVRTELVIHLIADQVPLELQRPIRDALKEFDHIRWYETRRQLGPYRATMSVFDYMETPFYAVQDSDDLSAPHRIWRSVQALRETGYHIFGGTVENFVDYRCTGPRSTGWLAEFPYHYSGNCWAKAPRGNVIHGAMTIRRSWFERMNGYMNTQSGGDTELIARATAMGAKVFVSDQVCGWRRMREASLSAGVSSKKLPPNEYYHIAFARKCEEEWKQPGCDFRSYGALDRYRDAHDIVRLRRDEL